MSPSPSVVASVASLSTTLTTNSLLAVATPPAPPDPTSFHSARPTRRGQMKCRRAPVHAQGGQSGGPPPQAKSSAWTLDLMPSTTRRLVFLPLRCPCNPRCGLDDDEGGDLSCHPQQRFVFYTYAIFHLYSPLYNRKPPPTPACATKGVKMPPVPPLPLLASTTM